MIRDLVEEIRRRVELDFRLKIVECSVDSDLIPCYPGCLCLDSARSCLRSSEGFDVSLIYTRGKPCSQLQWSQLHYQEI